MLQYHIDSLSRTEGSPAVIHCSGWLIDTDNLKTEIKLEDLSDNGAAIDVTRVSRPDLNELFRNSVHDFGFEIKIVCNEPEKQNLVFTNGTDKISIKLNSLTASQKKKSQISVKTSLSYF